MDQEFLEINTEWVYSNIYSLEGYSPKNAPAFWGPV